MQKSEISCLLDRMLRNARKFRCNASDLDLSVGKNEVVAEKLNSTADGIEIVVNAVRREFFTGGIYNDENQY